MASDALNAVGFIADQQFGPGFADGEGCREEERLAVAPLHDLATDSEGGHG